MELNLQLEQWELLDTQLKIVETEIAKRAENNEAAELIESVPGIGHYSAVAIASRIGDIERFRRPSSLANYFGLTPGCRNSGEATQRLGSITKRGSRIVRHLLNQAVIRLLREDPAMRAWFKGIKRRRGSKIARVAVMRRLATILWHVLKKKQKYRYEPLQQQKHEEFAAFEGSAA
jgi:transposase